MWNPGEPPVEGFTNLLWVLLATLVEGMGLPMPRTMQLLGVVCGVLTLVLTDRVAARHLGLDGWARALPVGLLALSGPLATWSASGLETPLVALLVLATLDAFATWQRDGRASAAARGVAWAALATLTRPDGVLVMAGAAVFALTLPGSWRRRLTPFFAFAVFLAGLTAWRLAVFGAPLPNTFYAKTGGGGLQALRGTIYAGFFAFHFLVPIVLFLAMSWRALVKAARPLPAALAVYTLLHMAYVIAVGGDYMAMDRFFVPVLAPLYLLAGVGGARLFDRLADPALRPVRIGLVALAAGLTVVHSTPLEKELFAKAPRQHGLYRGVETERWHVERLRLLARFFAERAGGSEASVATTAIGVLGYESGLAVYDLNGLVDPVIARGTAAERPLGSGLPGHEKSDPARVLARRPTFWMFTRRLRDKEAGWPRYDPTTDARLRDEYRRVHVWLEDVANGEAGHFTFLERRPEAERDVPATRP